VPNHNGADGGPSDHDDEYQPPAVPPEEVIREIASGSAMNLEHLRSLSNASDETVAAFMPLWPSLEPQRRRELLATLQHLGEEDATLDFHRLHLTALRDPDAATRILAIRGLWEQDREEYMRLLMDPLQADSEASVRAAAAEVLGQYVVGMEFGLMSEETADDLSSALRERIEDVNESEEVRATALEALGASSEDWVAELIGEQYDAGSHRMRIASLRAMGRNADDQWLGVLLHNFDDEDSRVRAVAALSAGQLLLEEALDPLVELIGDEDEEVQVAAVQALGEIAGPTVERILTDLMGHNDEHVRDAARSALAEVQFLGQVEVGEPDDDLLGKDEE
jgi:HEAT repeat protein